MPEFNGLRYIFRMIFSRIIFIEEQLKKRGIEAAEDPTTNAIHGGFLAEKVT